MSSFNLENHGLTVAEIHHNLTPSSLYEHAIRFEKDASIAENGALVALTEAMHASTFIGLLEEMVDIKVQQQTEAHLKTTPEVAAVLHQKRETDRRRLDQIRAELVRILTT